MTAKKTAKKAAPVAPDIANYWAILPENKFMHEPSRTMLSGEVIDKLFGPGTSRDLIRDRGCMHLTWAPGAKTVIYDRCVVNGAWITTPGAMVFNQYMPPIISDKGDPKLVGPWLELGGKLWDDQLDHLLDWLGFKVQHPEIKINHCIVLGSNGQGIGKDTWLHPVGHAIGRHNWKNISAGRAYKNADDFNAFLESVIVRISEAHDMKEKRFEFYDKMKDWCAAPPETLEVANKHVKAHPIMNVVGLIVTTNHMTDGLYWPAEDRRNYFAWSKLTASHFPTSYWKDVLWPWYKKGGCDHVAAFLRARNLKHFDPFAPPPKTAAWHAVVAANPSGQDAGILDALDYMGDASDFGEPEPIHPDVFTITSMRDAIQRNGRLNDLYNFLGDTKKNGKLIPHRFAKVGYTAVSNPDNAAGYWRIDSTRQIVYAKSSLSVGQQHKAVRAFIATQERQARWARKASGAKVTS